MLTVTLSHWRGWLRSNAAASIARIDAELGRALQITEAGRTAAQQNAHYHKYLTYLRGGPWAPIALKPGTSLHESGLAIDTDDRITHILNRHGWFHTVYRNGVLVEPWHYEYQEHRDQHRNQPAGGGIIPITVQRKKTMATLYHHLGKTLFALGGDSPGTSANWLETEDQGFANKLASVHGSALSVTPDTWAQWKSRYLEPLNTKGGATVNVDTAALASGIASKISIPTKGSITLS